MIDTEVIKVFITAIVSILAGGGGVFAYLSNKQKNKQQEHDTAVSEWKDLYDEMRKRLDMQEEENRNLRNELYRLKDDINVLSIELQNYKKYDTYINSLEKYIEQLLHSLKPLITDEAYKNLNTKRPQKIVNIDKILEQHK